MTAKEIYDELNSIDIEVMAACELLNAVGLMYEEHVEERSKFKLPDNLTSEYRSIQIRFVSDIESQMEKLEKVITAIRVNNS